MWARRLTTRRRWPRRRLGAALGGRGELGEDHAATVARDDDRGAFGQRQLQSPAGNRAHRANAIHVHETAAVNAQEPLGTKMTGEPVDLHAALEHGAGLEV